MPKTTTTLGPGSGDRPLPEGDLSGLVRRMSCACAARAAHADAPLARAMFDRVDAEGQSPEAAARALGIGSGDAAYLLAGLRRDVAIDLALMLLAGHTPGRRDPSNGEDT